MNLEKLPKKEMGLCFALLAHFLLVTNHRPFIRLLYQFLGPRKRANEPQKLSQSTRLSFVSLSDKSVELAKKFETAYNLIKDCPTINNADKLKLYGLFKQAKVGDVNKPKPEGYIAGLKWEAWKNMAGMDPVEAMKEYIGCTIEILKVIGSPIGPIDFSSDDDPSLLPSLSSPQPTLIIERSSLVEMGSSTVQLSRVIGEKTFEEEEEKMRFSVKPETLYFYLLLKEKKFEELRSMIRTKQLNVDSQFDDKGLLPMHFCILEEDLGGFNFMMMHSNDINIKDLNGNTPLHAGVLIENMEIVNTILKFHPNPYIKDDSGRTPIDIARGAVLQRLEEYKESYNKEKELH